MTTHTGGCHCKKVRYEVNANITSALECNCSHCAIKGLLLTFVPATEFTLLEGEENLTEYRFNTLKIQHLFCKTCGVESFGRGVGKDGVVTIAINVRCLDGIDLSTITRTPVDGKSY
jgi:hypothetical protein